jgi:hypothetical protein
MSLTDKEKEMIISKILDSTEGRAALSKAMSEPIRCYRYDYNSLKESPEITRKRKNS